MKKQNLAATEFFLRPSMRIDTFFLRHRRKSFRPLSEWMQMPARYWYQVQNFMIKLHDKVSNFLFSFSRSSDQARRYMSRGGGDHMKVGSRDPTQAEFGTWLNSRRGSGEAHPLLSFFSLGRIAFPIGYLLGSTDGRNWNRFCLLANVWGYLVRLSDVESSQSRQQPVFCSNPP